MSRPVQVPADVEREDTLIGQLTARQVAVLAITAAAVYGLWRWCGPAHLLAFGAAAIPITVVGVAFTVGRRDGMALDRLLWAGLRQRASLGAPNPRRALTAASRSRTAAGRGSAGSGRVVAAPLPVRGVRALGSDGLGLVDLGGAGSAVVCSVSPVNLWLRSGPEQDAVVAGFARWVQSLSAPVQILTRTRPLDLSGSITRLHIAAHSLAHPALARAAMAHADHLRALDAQSELLHREFLLVFRDRTATGHGSRALSAGAEALRRRTIEAAALLGPVGLRVTPLRAPDTAAVLRRATAPATAVLPEHRPTPPAPPRQPGRDQQPGRPTAEMPPGQLADWSDAPTVELPIVAPWAADPSGPHTDGSDHVHIRSEIGAERGAASQGGVR